MSVSSVSVTQYQTRYSIRLAQQDSLMHTHTHTHTYRHTDTHINSDSLAQPHPSDQTAIPLTHTHTHNVMTHVCATTLGLEGECLWAREKNGTVDLWCLWYHSKSMRPRP